MSEKDMRDGEEELHDNSGAFSTTRTDFSVNGEQKSGILDNPSGDPHHQSCYPTKYSCQQPMLPTGLNLPLQQTTGQLTCGHTEDRDWSATRLDQEHYDEDDDEEEENEFGSYLKRRNGRKRNYPHHRQRQPSGLQRWEAEGKLGNFQTRSASPSSITSESTDSLGDCENALDPPHLPTPNKNGSIGSAARSENLWVNGRRFSVLFSSEDTWNEENITQCLKELSADIKVIFEAAWAGDVHQLQKILKEAHVLDRLKDSEVTGYRDGEGRTPLHLASVCGHVDCVKLLIQNGAPVNATDGKEARATPLTCAASCGSVPVVKALLAGGANVNAGFEHGKTALHWAVQAGSVKCARVLLEANAKQNAPQVYSETPLHVAASQGDSECLQLLLNYGADVNLCKGTNRSTALHLSCEEGRVACVRFLLKAGATHTAKDARGHTALHVAATCDVDCVIALIESGADLNAIDANGRTPLHCAVARGSRAAECVRILVETGADINAQDDYGYTPLHLSAVNESSQFAAILLQHGGDVTLKTTAGMSALSLLVRKIPDVMRYIVERFDSAVTIHDHDPADPDCEVRLDFRAIVPNCEKHNGSKKNVNKKNKENGHVSGGGCHGNGKQEQNNRYSRAHKETDFLTSLMAAGNKKILAHPLSEAFLTLKWRRVRKFFVASLLFQIALVALFTIYVVDVYLIRCPYRRGPYNDQSGALEPGHMGHDGIPREGQAIAVPTLLPLPPSPPDLKPELNKTRPHNGHEITRRSAHADPGVSDWMSKWFGIMPPASLTPRSNSQGQSQSASYGHNWSTTPSSVINTTEYRFSIVSTPATVPKDSMFENENPCQIDPTLHTIWILLIIFVGCMAIKEVLQLFQNPLGYIRSFENWGQWLLIASVCVTMTPWSTPDFRPVYWQYPVVAYGIFLAWGLLLAHVGRFPALGLYVQMLGKVAANFGFFILAYAFLLIAFAFAFCVMFPEQPPYSTVPLSLLKVLAMMVGQLNYENFFYEESRRDDPVLMPIAAHLMYAAFIVFVTIILMNLLVGLAVSDIQGIQKGAKLNRLCRQTELISRLESFIFSKKLQSVLPHSLGSLLLRSASLVPSSYNWSYYFRPNDPRDKRLPKDIKTASLRLASSRHSSTKSKTSDPHHRFPQPRNAQVSNSSTPRPPKMRHIVNSLIPNHHSNNLALQRLDQKLNRLQIQLGQALDSLNRRMDQVLEGMGNPPSAVRSHEGNKDKICLPDD